MKQMEDLYDKEWEDTKQEITLLVPNEFSFSENLKYLSNAPNECMFRIKDQRIYKAIRIEQKTFIVEISADYENQMTVRFFLRYNTFAQIGT